MHLKATLIPFDNETTFTEAAAWTRDSLTVASDILLADKLTVVWHAIPCLNAPKAVFAMIWFPLWLIYRDVENLKANVELEMDATSIVYVTEAFDTLNHHYETNPMHIWRELTDGLVGNKEELAAFGHSLWALDNDVFKLILAPKTDPLDRKYIDWANSVSKANPHVDVMISLLALHQNAVQKYLIAKTEAEQKVRLQLMADQAVSEAVEQEA